MIRRPARWLIVEGATLAVLLVVALDLYAHRRVEMLAGLNIHGYRGAVAHQRQPNEIRIEVIGGTRAFGLGMPASWTPATVLGQEVRLAIDRPGAVLRPVVSLTLGRPGALPASYPSTIERFAHLRPDYICIYDDLGVGGALQPEETSWIFAHSGYWPALPLVLREKGLSWRYGTVGRGYAAGPHSDVPWNRRVAGVILEATGSTLATIDGLSTSPAARTPLQPAVYANDLRRAIDVALRHARGVVLAVSPAETPAQAARLAALLPQVDRVREAAPQFRFVNLDGIPDLVDSSQRLDGWSYGGDVIARAARTIAPAVLDLIGRAPVPSR
jgi:hypothetical protein